MMHAVRCPSCRNLSRVGAEAIGQTVACPHCGRPFLARPDPEFAPARPPVARPVTRRPRPTPADDIPLVAPPVTAPLPPETHAGPPASLIALVLTPLGIPLLWLMGPALIGTEPIFSFAAPVALAICACGLGLGVSFAQGWTLSTRVKGVVMLVLAAYFTGGFLYFMKKEWAEAMRRHVGPGAVRWQVFQPPHDRKAYRVQLPGPAREAEGDRAMPGWGLKAYRFAPDPNATKNALEVAYEVAHGIPPPTTVPRKATDEEWFAAARQALVHACDGELARESEVKPNNMHPGREYVLVLPDGSTNRIVRVYRAGDRAFYLAVEGAFVPGDAHYVREMFFDSFLIDPK